MTEIVDRNFVMRLDSQVAWTSLYSIWSLLFSTAGRAKPKLGMELSSFEKKATNYWQTRVEKRKTMNSSFGKELVLVSMT